MGGAVAIFAANIGASLALPLAKNPNHRTLPEVINSVKALPNADRLIIHPILAEAIMEAYGKKNGPYIEYLRRLEAIEVGGGKLSSNVANDLRDLGIKVVSRQTNKCYHLVTSSLRHSLLTISRGPLLHAAK
jgi:hypothetical protein